jgi:hypothetical protein
VSRFDRTRKGKIVIWTSAALAWGTAVTVARLEPARADQGSQLTPPDAPASTIETSVLPSGDPKGMVILRFQPRPDEQPEVRTVYVRRQPTQPSAPTASAAPQPKAPAPAPRSKGS